MKAGRSAKDTSLLLDGSITEETFLKHLREVIAQSDQDANAMYTKYQAESFSQNHNVLLVSHSQGNLFANKIYALLDNDERSHFKNVAIATPADKVASGGAYTTNDNDFVINGVLGSLPGNAEGFGHTFVPSYLNNPNTSTKGQIVNQLNQAVGLFDSMGCGKYTAYQFVGYVCSGASSASNFDVDIYGAYYEGNLVYTEAVMQEKQSPGDYDANGQCVLQDIDIQTLSPNYDKGGCDAYIIKSFSTQVKPMGFSNAITCVKYQISVATADKLNTMLMTTP